MKNNYEKSKYNKTILTSVSPRENLISKLIILNDIILSLKMHYTNITAFYIFSECIILELFLSKMGHFLGAYFRKKDNISL